MLSENNMCALSTDKYLLYNAFNYQRSDVKVTYVLKHIFFGQTNIRID